MEVNQQNLQSLAAVLDATTSASASDRKGAEVQLENLKKIQGYPLLLLTAIGSADAAPKIRKSAAVQFKNLINQAWKPESEHVVAVHDADREAIKNYLLNMMTMNLPTEIRKLTSASLQTISRHDFPSKWPTLLPEMVARLAAAPDFGVIVNIMKALSPVFKGYRAQIATDNLMRELIKVLNEFAGPFTEIFKRTVSQLTQSMDNLPVTRQLLEGLRTMLSIFYSLNAVDIPEYFQDNIQDYMQCFHILLTYAPKSPQLLIDEKNEDAPGPLTRVWAQVFSNLYLYNSKYDEEFEPYVGQLVQDAWALLNQALLEARFDVLVTKGIQFIASVAKSVNHTLFNNPEVLKTICHSIVVPNVRFRESDEESFDIDPIDYIRADVEGVDVETRRRAVLELVRALRKFYEQPITEILGNDITRLLGEYSANPDANWRSKDQVIFLVIALAQRTQTAEKGATSINTLVPLATFYQSQILPELLDNPNHNPVIKADALKFALAFRSQFSQQQLAELMPCFVKCLAAESYVVVSYACMCLFRIVPMLPLDALANFVAPLFSGMFSVIAKKEHSENQYVMRTIWRVIRSSGVHIAPMSQEILKSLCNKLSEIYKNPTDPRFLHYLFESMSSAIGALIKSDNLGAVEQAEVDLNQMFSVVLTEDILELLPYVYQIMGLFIESKKKNPQDLVKRYGEMFRQFLAPNAWLRTGNVPALTRLVRAYIKFAPEFVGPQLEPVLGVFQKLIASKTHDRYGLMILNDIIFHVPPTFWDKFYGQVLNLLMTRLQGSKTLTLITGVIFNLAITLLKHGPQTLIGSLDKLQPGLFTMLYKQIWLPNVPGIPGRLDRKTVALAMCQLLFNYPPFLQAPFVDTWSESLSGIVLLLSEAEEERLAADYDKHDDDVIGEGSVAGTIPGEEAEFSNVFAQLSTAGELENDYFPEIDAQQHFVTTLKQWSSANPGFVPIQINAMIPKNQAALQALFEQNKIPQPYVV